MRSHLSRAAAMAGLFLVLAGPATGLAPAVLAQSGTGAFDTSWPRDISWPQCGGSYPAPPAYGIVGVNAGIVFSPNPCLASEIAWAGGAGVGLYANTGNPGPALSSHWPDGQTAPMQCDANDPDTAACAYDYGYNAARDSYATAVAAFNSLGLTPSPAASAWWLDVETENSWRSNPALNVADLQGAVDFLGSVAQVASIGFYSTQYQWDVITGNTSAFAAYQSWVAGSGDTLSASINCGGPGFTGGGIALSQYQSGGYDVDLRCSSITQVPSAIDVSPASAGVQTGGVQRFNATVVDQFGQPLYPQPAVAWSVSGGGAIDSSGVFSAGSTPGGPFTVTATSGSVSGTAGVSVTAPPTLASISVAPASPSVQPGGTHQFTATGLDQNGRPLYPQPAFAWSVSGGGTIDPSGVFSAGSTTGGPFTVTATSGGVSGTASLTVAPVGDVATANGRNDAYSIAYGLTAQPAGGSYALDGSNYAIAVAVADAAGNAITANVSFSYAYAPAGIFTLGAPTYDPASGAWVFDATCQAPGTASVTITATGTSATAHASSHPLSLTCAAPLTPASAGAFVATIASTAVPAKGVATITVAVKDDHGLPAPDGTPVTVVTDGAGNVVGTGGIVGAATTVDGAATLTYVAPAQTGGDTATVSVANATPALQALAISIVAPPPAAHYAAASAAGVTRTGPFTTTTKVRTLGQYVTLKLSLGAAAAGSNVTIEAATKTGAGWGPFKALTGRVADSGGNVYFFWKSATHAWLSFRAVLDGATSNAVQVRWV